jgi:hypothetical protein
MRADQQHARALRLWRVQQDRERRCEDDQPVRLPAERHNSPRHGGGAIASAALRDGARLAGVRRARVTAGAPGRAAGRRRRLGAERQEGDDTKALLVQEHTHRTACARSAWPGWLQSPAAMSGSAGGEVDGAPGDGAPGESVSVEARGEFAALATWSLPNFSKVRAKQLWSRHFSVGGYAVRLLLYPKGDSQALPGYLSLYVQVSDPRCPSGKWDCFASYRLAVQHAREPDAKSVGRDSWHRFSGKKRSHGWCDFTPVAPLADTRSGFCANDTLVVTAEIMVLHESVAFEREGATRADGGEGGSGSVCGPPVVSVGAACIPTGNDVLAGKFTWRVHNFSLFQARAVARRDRGRAARPAPHARRRRTLGRRLRMRLRWCGPSRRALLTTRRAPRPAPATTPRRHGRRNTRAAR